jgi:periplasmic protein TonB
MLTSHSVIPSPRTRSFSILIVVLIVHIGIAWFVSSAATNSHEPATSIKMLESFVISNATGQTINTPSEQMDLDAAVESIAVPAKPQEDSVQQIQKSQIANPETVKQKKKINQKLEVAKSNVYAATPSLAGSGDSLLPISNAKYLNNPHPAYPRQSKRLGEQGTVLLEVEIDVDGSANKIHVRKSSGFSRLDKSALETVMKWRFIPGKTAGVSQKMWVSITINFVLE